MDKVTTRSAVYACALLALTALPVQAQWPGTVPVGTTLSIRTTQAIGADAADGQIFTGIVDQDVLDSNGQVTITKGSTAELEVRQTPNKELVLDLDSVTVNGQRYATLATPASVGTSGS